MNSNQEKSRKSISAKIKRINQYIVKGIPVKCDDKGNQLYKGNKPLLEYTPTTLNQFLNWSDGDYFLTTGKSALEKYLSHTDKEVSYIEDLVTQLENKKKTQLSKDGEIELSERLMLAGEVMESQNSSIAKYLIQIQDLNEELEKLAKVNQNLLKHLELKESAYESQLADLKKQIDRLSNLRSVK